MKTSIQTLLLLTCIFLGATHTAKAQITYTDVATLLGLSHTCGPDIGLGGGASFYDFNQDGWDDLTLTVLGDSIVFYQNTGSGFQQINALVPYTGNSKQALWVDYDNDGDKDLYVAGDMTGNKLYRNDSGSMTDVTVAAGIPTDSMPTFGVSFGDYDRDSYLDLYITNRVLYQATFSNYLYHNNGDGTFTNVTLSAGVSDSLKAPFGACFTDINQNGWADLYIYQDKTTIANTLFKNMEDGTFQDISVSSGTDYYIDAMCLAIADYDMDGDLDMYCSNNIPGAILLKNNGDETFTEVAGPTGVGFYGIGWGANFLDYDNDRDADLYASGQSTGPVVPSAALFENMGNGNFTQPAPTSIGMAGDTVWTYANAIGDFNNDGFPDIATSNPDLSGNMNLWQNSADNGKNWIKIELEGTISNRDGIGTWIEIWTGGLPQYHYTHCGIGYLAQNSQYILAGLDTFTCADSINLWWQNGHRDHFEQVKANKKITLVEAVSVDPSPVINMSPMALCPDNTSGVILDAGSGYNNYLWSTGDTTQTITVFTPGTYDVWVENQWGLSSTSASVNVIAPGPITLNLGEIGATLGNSDGSAWVTASGSIAPYAYLWNDPSNQITATATGLSSGTYWVIVTDSVGCSVTDSVFVSSFTGLIDLSNDNAGMLVLPNPVTGKLTLKLGEELAKDQITLQVFDLVGATIMSWQGIPGDNLSLNLPKTMADGNYMVRVSSKAYLATQQFIYIKE